MALCDLNDYDHWITHSLYVELLTHLFSVGWALSGTSNESMYNYLGEHCESAILICFDILIAHGCTNGDSAYNYSGEHDGFSVLLYFYCYVDLPTIYITTFPRRVEYLGRRYKWGLMLQTLYDRGLMSHIDTILMWSCWNKCWYMTLWPMTS